ncbi:MAG: outer membrane beta-barrel protein [Lentimicrobiaceae bacterium]|nr:outer membrane beta-barrel protein [Lentimicrobiaceae bacterium]MCO5265117.1 DUF6089 family protein [Lentimicrobium sp.]HPG32916.1 DUF6089 family protein [Lentimicrobium sp.]
MKKLSVLFLILITLTASAQRYGEVGITGGGMYYLGDLNPGKQFLLTQPAFGGFLRHNFNERLAIKTAFTFGMVKGDDAISDVHPDRNLNFQSSITDFSATFEFNFLEYFIGSMNHSFTPYMFAGVSGFLYNPKADLNGSLIELRTAGTEGQGTALYPDRKQYSKLGFSIPFGIGFKYSLNSFMGLSLSWTMHRTYTDYLDDVSTTYYIDATGITPNVAPEEVLLSDPTLSHKAGMQRGDSQYNDWFSVAAVSVSFRINYLDKQRCLNIFY